MDHTYQRDDTDRTPHRGKWVLLGFMLIAGFFLSTEHRAHLLGFLPYLLFLACPLILHSCRSHLAKSNHGVHGWIVPWLGLPEAHDDRSVQLAFFPFCFGHPCCLGFCGRCFFAWIHNVLFSAQARHVMRHE